MGQLCWYCVLNRVDEYGTPGESINASMLYFGLDWSRHEDDEFIELIRCVCVRVFFCFW